MKVVIERKYKKSTYTIGNLYIDGKYICDTLEDTDRNLDAAMSYKEIQSRKVKGNTAIPKGEYSISMNIVSPTFRTRSWAKPYGGKIPRVVGVKGFSGILIHPGNTEADTEGCILVGVNKVKGQVINSRETFKELYKLLKDKHDKGEKITIKIL